MKIFTRWANAFRKICGPVHQFSCKIQVVKDNRQVTSAKKAIVTFAQSEKVKAGFIWVSQHVEGYAELPARDQPGAVGIIRATLMMIYHEVNLAENLSDDDAWREVEKHMDMAMVMIDSGVAAEAAYHLTRALSQVAGIGGRALEILKRQGLF